MRRLGLNLLRLGLACGASLTMAPTLGLQLPREGPRDSRVRWVAYDGANVVRIEGAIRASTQIIFADDEEIAHIALGDAVSWEVAPVGSILFLKPRERHPPTNLQVVTARRDDGRKRSYQFELAVAESAPLDGSPFVVKFTYPGDEAERRRLAAAARRADREAGLVDEALEEHARSGAGRNWRYSAQGTPALEPDGVSDDGQQTTFRFAGQREVPAIYLVNGDGSESLVPKTMRGELVIVHAIGRLFRLRRGAEVLCIHNEAFDPVGTHQGTNTTSPRVVRAPKPVTGDGLGR